MQAKASTASPIPHSSPTFIPSYREFNILNSQDQMSVFKELEGGGSLSPETVLYQTRYGVYGLMYDNAIKYKNKEYLQDNTLEGRTAVKFSHVSFNECIDKNLKVMNMTAFNS